MKLQPFRLERYFARYEFTAPYLLCSSDCESMTVGELLALEPGAEARFQDLGLGYTESPGDPELRGEIAASYDTVDGDGILVHSGAEEGIFNFMNAVVEPGDRVIVQAPHYQSLGEVATGLGAEVVPWWGDAERGWAPDLGRLRELLAEPARLVVVNLPNNPTGYLPDRKWLDELVALVEDHGCWIFSDEVYRGLELDPLDQLPALVDLSPKAVSLGVMSKTYGLAGLRIGWLATRDPELYRRLASFKDYTTICNSAPSEFLATVALRHGATLVERNLGIVRHNLTLLDAFFERHRDRFEWHRPRAGAIGFPRLLEGSVDRLCADLVEQAGVLLLPGTLFEPGLEAFRIGFGRRNLSEALARFEAFLSGNGGGDG